MIGADAVDGHTGFILSNSGITGILANGAFISAFVGFATAQVLKVFTHWYKEGKWDIGRLIGSGGMPSSHSALMLGLTSSVGVSRGTDSDLFAICLVISLIVMYDACGVRLQAGRHAGILNQIISELPPDHLLSDSRPLHVSLGHTPLQVMAGMLVGMVMGYITQTTIESVLHHEGHTNGTLSPVILEGKPLPP